MIIIQKLLCLMFNKFFREGFAHTYPVIGPLFGYLLFDFLTIFIIFLPPPFWYFLTF
jgi:hypothetical protein